MKYFGQILLKCSLVFLSFPCLSQCNNKNFGSYKEKSSFFNNHPLTIFERNHINQDTWKNTIIEIKNKIKIGKQNDDDGNLNSTNYLYFYKPYFEICEKLDFTKPNTGICEGNKPGNCVFGRTTKNMAFVLLIGLDKDANDISGTTDTLFTQGIWQNLQNANTGFKLLNESELIWNAKLLTEYLQAYDLIRAYQKLKPDSLAAQMDFCPAERNLQKFARNIYRGAQFWVPVKRNNIPMIIGGTLGLASIVLNYANPENYKKSL